MEAYITLLFETPGQAYPLAKRTLGELCRISESKFENTLFSCLQKTQHRWLTSSSNLRQLIREFIFPAKTFGAAAAVAWRRPKQEGALRVPYGVHKSLRPDLTEYLLSIWNIIRGKSPHRRKILVTIDLYFLRPRVH